MKTIFSFTFIFFISLFFNACADRQPLFIHSIKADCSYYSLLSAQCLDQREMIKRLRPYQVIFIGDHHTEDDLHKKIAELITALSQDGFTIYLANEWFYPSDYQTLEDFSNKTTDETMFLKGIQWEKRLKNYRYESFKPLYESIRENHGKLRGINLTTAERKIISDQNLSSMDEAARRFNTDLDLSVEPHQEFIMPYFSHCHAPKKHESLQECRQRMYRVQVAWDTKMALESSRLAKELKKNEKLLVFAGSMHIENKLGVPLRFARFSTLPTLSILPESQHTKAVNNGYADFLLFYEEKESSNQ